ncbi:MAG: putative toxin-antitoxin system toxin component, PIN family [Desulfococcaceae bacterium]
MKSQAVFDTNVLISGVLWRGVPFQLLRLAEDGIIEIYSSADILREIYKVLFYPKFRKFIDKNLTSADELFEKIESLCTLTEVNENIYGVCSDPDDEKFLSCALSSDVNILVSGDRHLLSIKQYKTIRILNAQEFHSILI